MTIPLTTLEGIDTVQNRLLSRKTPYNFRQPGNTHLASTGFALYGEENVYADEMEPMAGWLTSLKKGVSSAVSSVADAGSSVVRGTGGAVMDVARSVVPVAADAYGRVAASAANSASGGATGAAAQSGAPGSFSELLGSVFKSVSSQPNSPIPVGVNSSGQVIYAQPTSQLPSWLLPVGILGGLGIVAYVVTRPRRR